jgi:DNA-binding transcriptional LysR family regulator
MNLKQLKYFCEVVDAGSAAQAAPRLYVAPTAISMQLAQLEKHLGGELLDRSTRPMRLTPLGRFFHPRALELLAQAKSLDEDAQRVAAAKQGWLGIGFTRSAIFSILPAAVRRFREVYPEVRIELVELLSEHQAAPLHDGKIHIGIARYVGSFDPPAGLACSVLFEEPFVAAVPIGHPLARRASLSVEDIATVAFISYPKDPNTQFGARILLLLERAGAMPEVGYEAIEIHTALGLVAAGLGLTLVGRSVAEQNRTDVAFIPIDDLPDTTTIAALTREGEVSDFVEPFLRMLRRAS